MATRNVIKSVTWGVTGATLFATVKSDGTTVRARSSSSVIEWPTGSGCYELTLSLDDTKAHQIAWDDGTDSAVEDFLIPASSSGGGADAADIWSYGQRSLTASSVTVQPAQQFAEREIVKGNSYGTGGRSFLVTIQDGAEWPTTPSAWTWTLTADKHPDNLASGSASFTGSGTGSGTGTSRAVDVTLSAATTGAAAVGLYAHSLRGTSGSDVWTIELGLLNVRDDAAA